MQIHKLKYPVIFLMLQMYGNMVSAASPVLSFAGQFDYSYSDVTSIGFLTITGNLINTEDLSISPVLANSQFLLKSKFNSLALDAGETTGIFGSSMSQLSPWDFNIISGDNINLLQGSVNTLTMSGINGFTFGLISGDLEVETGALKTDFENPTSSLLGLTFNLSESISQNMFKTGFSGNVNGSVAKSLVSVDESSSIFLLLIGFAGLLGKKLTYSKNK